MVSPITIAVIIDWLARIGLACRAYKLGKKRWLYNECRIKIRSMSGCFRNLQIKEATRTVEEVLSPELMVREACLCCQIITGTALSCLA